MTYVPTSVMTFDARPGIGYPARQRVPLAVQRTAQDSVEKCSIFHNIPFSTAFLTYRISSFPHFLPLSRITIQLILILHNTLCNALTIQFLPIVSHPHISEHANGRHIRFRACRSYRFMAIFWIRPGRPRPSVRNRSRTMVRDAILSTVLCAARSSRRKARKRGQVCPSSTPP
jgi:hypothetical protein